MLEQELKRFTEDHSLIIILCIGNDMRGDDAVGPLIADSLGEIFEERKDIMVINTKTVPENYTGLIRREEPSHIIFIDAIEMKMEPGQIKMVQRDKISDYSVSTHAMPLSFMIKYIESFTNAKMILIGIQPKNIDMTREVSKEVKSSVEELTKIIKNIFMVKESFHDKNF